MPGGYGQGAYCERPYRLPSFQVKLNPYNAFIFQKSLKSFTPLNKPMADINIPLPDRTFARSKGCWNCTHAGDPATVGLPHWLNECRPRDERKILAPLKDELAKIPAEDKRTSTKARRSELLKVIEKHAQLIEAHETAIREGKVIRCTNRLCKDPGDFKSHRFLCDQWSGATGASLAQGGAATADMLPEELKDVFGDGN